MSELGSKSPTIVLQNRMRMPRAALMSKPKPPDNWLSIAPPVIAGHHAERTAESVGIFSESLLALSGKGCPSAPQQHHDPCHQRALSVVIEFINGTGVKLKTRQRSNEGAADQARRRRGALAGPSAGGGTGSRAARRGVVRCRSVPRSMAIAFRGSMAMVLDQVGFGDVPLGRGS